MWLYILLSLVGLGIFILWFCVFFDQAVLNRRETIYRVPSHKKQVALTFDDGPSPVWTPLILDELKKVNTKATFFMIGYHVQMYPDIALRVAKEGHTIANHGYAHSVILYYTLAEIEAELKYTEFVIREITGETTQFFRPPKAWMRQDIKDKIKSMGYDIVLWSLNSKDWVAFSHRYIVNFILRRVKNGDIILFHDSGNIFSREGGDRTQTVKAIGLLIGGLKKKGFECATLTELLNGS